MDYMFGDPYWFPHPVKFIGKFINFFEGNVRKVVLTKKLKIAGFFLVLSTVSITYLCSLIMLLIAKFIHPIVYITINIILIWTCFAAKCLKDEALKVYYAIKEGDINLSRQLISYLVGRDTDHLNEKEIIKATVETVAENTSDGVIAPLFYMLIGGAPLGLVYKAINTMDSMVGYKNDEYLDFGFFAAKLDDVANYVPARITGLLIALTSVILNFNWKQSFKILVRDSNNHSSPNSGFPEAAVAGALDIGLGGTSIYFGKKVEKPTIGEDVRTIEVEDIKRTSKLMYGSTVIFLVVCYFIF